MIPVGDLVSVESDTEDKRTSPFLIAPGKFIPSLTDNTEQLEKNKRTRDKYYISVSYMLYAWRITKGSLSV